MLPGSSACRSREAADHVHLQIESDSWTTAAPKSSEFDWANATLIRWHACIVSMPIVSSRACAQLQTAVAGVGRRLIYMSSQSGVIHVLECAQALLHRRPRYPVKPLSKQTLEAKCSETNYPRSLPWGMKMRGWALAGPALAGCACFPCCC